MGKFEAGFDRIVALRFAEEIEGVREIRVGSRTGRVRVEAGGDRAWEFDPAGRLIVAQEDSTSLHATADGRLWGHRVRGEGSGRRLVPAMAPENPGAWLREIHTRIRRWAAAPSESQWEQDGEGSAAEFAHRMLGPAAARTPAVLEKDIARCKEIWRRIPVLPPDQYEALVVQISEGCPWDRCRFCSLYRDVPFRDRSPDEVTAHVDEILEWLGDSAGRVKRIFLGQANALLRPTGELLEVLARIRERIPLAPDRLESNTPSVNGFYSFVDAFHLPRPVGEWNQLRQAGLRRVYIGLESGDEERLRALGKPLDPKRAVELVADLHRAGIPAGVILLTGIAPGEAEARHRERSAEVLSRMELRPGDQVYLSPLVHPSGSAIESIPGTGGKSVQGGSALERMREAIRPGLTRGVPIAVYDLERLQQRTPRG